MTRRVVEKARVEEGARRRPRAGILVKVWRNIVCGGDGVSKGRNNKNLLIVIFNWRAWYDRGKDESN